MGCRIVEGLVAEVLCQRGARLPPVRRSRRKQPIPRGPQRRLTAPSTRLMSSLQRLHLNSAVSGQVAAHVCGLALGQPVELTSVPSNTCPQHQRGSSRRAGGAVLRAVRRSAAQHGPAHRCPPRCSQRA